MWGFESVLKGGKEVVLTLFLCLKRLVVKAFGRRGLRVRQGEGLIGPSSFVEESSEEETANARTHDN